MAHGCGVSYRWKKGVFKRGQQESLEQTFWSCGTLALSEKHPDASGMEHMGTIIKKKMTAAQIKRLLKGRRGRKGFDPKKHSGVINYKRDPVAAQRQLRDGD